MAGPWERYQTQTPKASGASGPWERYAAPQKEDAGFFGSLIEGAKTLGIADEAAAFAADPSEANRRALIKAGESKYRQVGFGEGQNWEAFKQLLGGSIGQLAAPVAAGLAATPLTTPLGGLAAASATSGAQYTSQNLLRQAQEQERAIAEGKKPEDTSVGKAILAATGQTALDVAGGKVFTGIAKAFPFMRPLLGNAGGRAAQNAGEVLADAAANGTIKFAKGVATGVGKGVAFEVPQEVAQQGLERWQAGLSLSDKQAQSEYGQAAIGALLLGGGLGGVSGGISARTKAAPVEEAPAVEVEGEAAPAGGREDVFKLQKEVTKQLADAAGPKLSTRAKNAVDTLGRVISNDIATPTPESVARSEEYIKSWEDSLDTGMEYEPDVAEPLLRPKLKDDGSPDVDEETGKPIYEGALAEAKRMVAEARKRLEAAPVESAPVEEAAAVESAPMGEAPGTYRTVIDLNGEEQVTEGSIRRVEEAAPVKGAPKGEALSDLNSQVDEYTSLVEVNKPVPAPLVESIARQYVDAMQSTGIEGLISPDRIPAFSQFIRNENTTIEPLFTQQATRQETPDLTPVYEAPNMKARKAAALDITTSIVESLPGVEAASVPKKVYSQISTQIAQQAAQGETFDPVTVARTTLAQNGIKIPEVAAAPEVATPEFTPQEAPDVGVGRPTAPVSEGVRTSVPPSGELGPAGNTTGDVGRVEPEPVGGGGLPPVPPTVSPNAEPNTLTPAPKMEVAPNWLINIADKFGQAELADNWAKSTFGAAAVPTELQTAPILERVETMQAGQQRDLKRDKFDPLIETAAKLGVDIGDFNYFLWLDHAAERNREVAKVNPQFPEGGAGITSAQAQEGLRQIEAEGLMPKYNLLKKKVQDLVKFNLQEDMKANLLSQGQVDALPYENYVPLKGFAADNDIMTADIDEDPNAVTARRDEAMKAMRAASPGGNIQEFRRAMGRGSMPLAPLFNLMQDSEQRVRRRVLNMARLPILRQWKKSPAAFDGILNVYTDANPKKVVVGHDRAGNKYAPVPSMEKEYYKNRENYMIVKDNGVTYYVEFDPTESGQALRRMFENMNPKDMEGAAKNVAAVNNFLKGMLTYKNPLHLLFVAPFRDVSSAIATAMHHQNLKGSPAYKKNLVGRTILYTMPLSGTWGTIARYVFTNKPMDTKVGKQLQEMLREGGAPLHARFTDIQQKTNTANQAIRQLQGKGGTNVLSALNKWVDNLADMMDLSARFATYRAASELGIQPADAARLALDSSLNLTRRGEKSRQLDLIFPFFATGIEATRKTKRMLVNGRGAVKILGALIAYGVLESMINSAVSGDDDDDGQENYLDQNNTMRIGRTIIYYGEGADDYVKLPIDPMLGYFKFVGNRIGDIMLGNATPGDVTGDLIFGAASVASPVRVPQADVPSAAVAFTPLVGKPIVENVLNRNFFGGPIYKESQFDSAPRSELGGPTVGGGWEWLARTINDATGGSEAVKGAVDFQPEVYRHLIEGYLGGPYQLTKQIAGLGSAEEAADIPGIKSFVGTGSEYAPQTKYFENSSTIRQIMNRLSKLTPEQRAAQGAEFTMDTDPRIVEAYQIVDKELDKLGKEQRETLEYMRLTGNRSSEDEKLVLDHYRAAKNELYSAFNGIYNDVKKEQ
jgi:hypothetical protein